MAEDNEKSGLHKVLSAADKGVLEPRGSAGLLAKAWRIILFKLRMDPARLNVAMRAYSRMLEERGIMDRAKANQERGNIRSSMGSPRMSMRKFWQNICVLGAVKLEMNIKVHFPNGQVVECDVSLRNSAAEHDHDEQEKEGD